MRPRVFPAEDSRGGSRRWASRSRFNEAAGIPRGRLVIAVRPPMARGASMRPRVFPAEDMVRRPTPSPVSPSFNEAAGIPRGRPSSRPRRRFRAASLQ